MSMRFFVANWKMQLPYSQAIKLCSDNVTLISELAHSPKQKTIILCPSFEALFPLRQLLQSIPISLGAQTCSSYSKGAYTGQVSAESLAQLGCTYCIVGHSERRLLCRETIQDTVAQVEQLLTHCITPIICIGETQQEYANKQTIAILEQQLKPIFAAIAQQSLPRAVMCIAYEPVWAIGSGIVPEKSYITDIFSWLRSYCNAQCPTHVIHLLYGGSVNTANSKDLACVPYIEGFLLGGGSLDFQKFKNIVSS